MNPDQVERIMSLRAELYNVLGFYDLMDSNLEATPLESMTWQVHFTASSVKVAQEMMNIINEILDDPPF